MIAKSRGMIAASRGMIAAIRRISIPTWGVIVALVLIAAASLIPFLTGWNVFVSFPPLHAVFSPRLGAGTIPALLIAVLAARFAIDLGSRVRWRTLLILTFVAAIAWMIALALVDGFHGLGDVLDLRSEYLNTARTVTDVGAMLREYISRIPLDSSQHWPVHLAGHPPGAVLFFIGLVHLGLGNALAAGISVVVMAATTPVAVLVTLRRLGAEAEARLAAPFLVFGSAAIWMAVSADAMFGAVAAWGLCCLALAATSRRLVAMAGWGVLSGLLLGYCVYLSYGLPLLGVLAVGILIIARAWKPALFAIAAALVVVAVFAAAGFAWWDAYPVLLERYWGGIASDRPFGYWIWADFSALAISAGPLVGATVAIAISWVRAVRTESAGTRTIVILVLAATVTVLLADASGMSRAEVERIWLPFIPWLLIGAALLPQRWRRIGLIGQLVFALAIQHLFATTW